MLIHHVPVERSRNFPGPAEKYGARDDSSSPGAGRIAERRGHALSISVEMGKVETVMGEAGGEVRAAQDPRGPGSAGVVRPAVD